MHAQKQPHLNQRVIKATTNYKKVLDFLVYWRSQELQSQGQEKLKSNQRDKKKISD